MSISAKSSKQKPVRPWIECGWCHLPRGSNENRATNQRFGHDHNERITEACVDMPTISTYIKYFMKHLKDLLIDHRNPVMRVRYFGVIFDQTPSCAKIDRESAEISIILGMNELLSSQILGLLIRCARAGSTLAPRAPKRCFAAAKQ